MAGQALFYVKGSALGRVGRDNRVNHGGGGGQGGLVMFGDDGWFLSASMLMVFAAIYLGLAYVALRKKDGPTGKPFAIPLLKMGTWVEARARLLWALRRVNDLWVAGMRWMVRKLAAKFDKPGTPSSTPPPGAPPGVPPPS